jgi:hypothetical protein
VNKIGSGATPLILLLMIWFSLCAGAFAQQQSVERIVSPWGNADHRVTIRFRAPKAKKVSVSTDGYRKLLRMTKDQNGVWSVRTDSLVPDLYGHSILSDGLFRLDSNNPVVRPNHFLSNNSVHVPGPSSLPGR